MKYRVIRDYVSYWYGFGILIPAGSIGEWFEQAKCYTFPAINGYIPCVEKWPVEAWHDFFEPVVEQTA